MAGSLAYVGTDFDQATLDKAISTLDNLVCVAVSNDTLITLCEKLTKIPGRRWP